LAALEEPDDDFFKMLFDEAWLLVYEKLGCWSVL